MDPIHAAAEADNLELVMILIEQFPHMVHSLSNDGNGYSALHFASLKGHVGLVAHLLDHGASINQCSRRYSYTPLSLACEKGHLEVVELLMERGADPSSISWNVVTPLMQASAGGHIEIVRRLLRHEPSIPINLRDDYHLRTALWRAADAGHVEVVRELLVEGADPTIKALNDETPLTTAIRKGHHDCVALLKVSKPQQG